MKNLSVILFCFFLFLLPKVLLDQELPNIIPPSPEAVSLGKFTKVSISYYTGLPNISVPLYQISFDGLSIPISLSYHAKGIQVAGVAPRVGLGWSLVAAGAITRQIRGLADDQTGGG